MSQDFEGLSVDVLADMLRRFYGEVRTQATAKKPSELYSKSGLRALRYGIQRHLQMPPYGKDYNLVRDRVFMEANQVEVNKHYIHWKK